MKKILLSIATICASALTLSAQVYYEEDFSGTLDSWTLVDNDGDGYGWEITGGEASSASWVSTANPQALNPDNIMTSAAIDLSAITFNLNLVIDVRGQDPDWTEEHYAVYVTTANDLATITAATPVLEETLPAQASTFVTKAIDISSFAGQTIYISIRHFSVTDMFQIRVDNIKIVRSFNNEVELVSVNADGFGDVGSSIQIKATVRNNGSITTSGFDVTWSDGTNTYTQNVPQPLAAFATAEVTFTDQLTLSAAQLYTYTVEAVFPNDEIPDNNTITTGSAGIATGTGKSRVVVLEEATGTWCGWCPRGAVMLNQMAVDYPTTSIGIAVHNGDVMAVTEYDGNMNVGGYPSGHVDRKVLDTDPGSFDTEYNNVKNDVTPIEASVASTWDAGTREIFVTGKATSMTDLKGDFRIAVVVLEDYVQGSGADYNQANYYSGGASGAMGGYENEADPVSAATMNATYGGHRHVAREILGGFGGEAGSMPSDIVADTEYFKSFVYTLPAGYDDTNIHLITLVIDNGNGQIVNAFKADLGTGTVINGEKEIKAERNISIYPNPNNGLFTIALNGPDLENYNVKVMNMAGQVVYTYNSAASGSIMKTFNVSHLDKGFYIVNVSTNSEEHITKMIIE